MPWGDKFPPTAYDITDFVLGMLEALWCSGVLRLQEDPLDAALEVVEHPVDQGILARA